MAGITRCPPTQTTKRNLLSAGRHRRIIGLQSRQERGPGLSENYAVVDWGSARPVQRFFRSLELSFVGLLREAGLPVLDVKSAIESEGDPMSCHFKTDPHWNARGHAVAARELFRAIRARGPK